MELNQLQQLVVIADENALFRAAKKLHISQSALTRSIQRLEDELGMQLFDRSHNSMKLNEAGKLAVRHARIVLREADALVTGLDAFRRQIQALHVVTCSPAPLWKLTAELSKQFPDIHITSAMPDENEIVSQLLSEKASIAITRQEIHTDQIESIPFIDERTFMLIPVSDSLSHKTSIHFSDLNDKEIYEYTNTGFWHPLLRNHIQRAHYIEYDDIMVYLSVIITQKPMTFVSGLAQEFRADLDGWVRVPIVDEVATAHLRIAWLKKNKPMLSDILNWVSETSRKW